MRRAFLRVARADFACADFDYETCACAHADVIQRTTDRQGSCFFFRCHKHGWDPRCGSDVPQALRSLRGGAVLGIPVAAHGARRQQLGLLARHLQRAPSCARGARARCHRVLRLGHREVGAAESQPRLPQPLCQRGLLEWVCRGAPAGFCEGAAAMQPWPCNTCALYLVLCCGFFSRPAPPEICRLVIVEVSLGGLGQKTEIQDVRELALAAEPKFARIRPKPPSTKRRPRAASVALLQKCSGTRRLCNFLESRPMFAQILPNSAKLGRLRIEFGRKGAEKGPTRGRNGSDSIQSGPHVHEFGATPAKLGQVGQASNKFRPMSTDVGPSVAPISTSFGFGTTKFGPKLTRFDQQLRESGVESTKFGPTASNFGQNWPEVGQIWNQFRPNLARCWPSWGHLERRSDDVLDR